MLVASNSVDAMHLEARVIILVAVSMVIPCRNGLAKVGREQEVGDVAPSIQIESLRCRNETIVLASAPGDQPAPLVRSLG